jgi:hypothetical protein
MVRQKAELVVAQQALREQVQLVPVVPGLVQVQVAAELQ